MEGRLQKGLSRGPDEIGIKRDKPELDSFPSVRQAGVWVEALGTGPGVLFQP